MQLCEAIKRSLGRTIDLQRLHELMQLPLSDVLERFVSYGLRLQDFTALFGCKDPDRARALLAEHERAGVYSGVYGIQTLRLMLFDPSSENGVVGLPRRTNQALVLSFVCDGNASDALAALVARNGTELAELFSLCHGFDSTVNLLDFIRRYAVPSGYLFRDRGPVGQLWSRLPDPSIAEIADAFRIQGRFARFFAQHGDKSAEDLRASFLQEFADQGFPFALTRVERRLTGEEAAMRQLSDTARKLQDKVARGSNDRLIRRAAHAKGHGLVHATLEVLDMASNDHRVGLFAEPKRYEAVLRASNANAGMQRDLVPDARGLALRVLVPTAEAIAGVQPRFLLNSGRADFGYQDFVLMSYPVFVSPDVLSFSRWFSTLQGEDGLGVIAGIGRLSASRTGLRQLGLFTLTSLKYVANPLACNYHSTTAYLLGDRFIAKYSLEPSNRHEFSRFTANLARGYLSDALVQTLSVRSIDLTLYLHVLSTDTVPRGYASIADVVEDATLDWRKLRARRVPVAVVRIGPQNPATIERLEQSERLRFNPWNALEQHRPLGSLNRARLVAYQASQRYRAMALQEQRPALERAAE
jgi:hypothetical protein